MSRWLAGRVLQPELMDDPGLDPVEHRHALEGLRRINALSRTASTLWSEVERVARAEGRSIRVLDVACGGGDVAIELQRRAQAARLQVAVEGCDISEEALRRARETSVVANAVCGFQRLDVLANPFPRGYDMAVSSLFLHHLQTSDVEALLRRLAAGARHLAISDLDRGLLGLAASWVGTRLISRSRVVHVDGPRSVRAAFTAAEIAALAQRAGLGGAKVQRRWPFRWLLTWSRA